MMEEILDFIYRAKPTSMFYQSVYISANTYNDDHDEKAVAETCSKPVDEETV